VKAAGFVVFSWWNTNACCQIRDLGARANDGSVDRAAKRLAMTRSRYIATILARVAQRERDAAQALVRVAEVNAGKRPPPAPDAPLEPVEALMLAMTMEAKTFEADLAANLGPEDAHRIASRMCRDRGTARAKPGSQ